MPDKAIRKISREKLDQVEIHARMLLEQASDRRKVTKVSSTKEYGDLAFDEAACILILEFIKAIKGEK